MDNGIKNLQHTLLEMLIELQNFCDENQICFFLVGGSALGAQRHHGFIPWDDDVDVAMMRPDFEKLQELMEEQQNRIGKFLYSPVEHHLLPDAPIAYLYDSEHCDKGFEMAAKVDIHPIDGVPENRFLRKIQKFFAKVYYLSIYRLPAKNKGKFAHDMTAAILKITPNWLFRIYQKVSKRVITSWPESSSREICSLFGVAGYETEVMPRAYLMPLQRAEFEQHEFWIPGDIDPYLKRLYGDYMTLPPKEERIPRHPKYQSYSQED
ncbi:MAG: phosphorylcholine transferase LicD [Lachnospiraceae bacterium]